MLERRTGSIFESAFETHMGMTVSEYETAFFGLMNSYLAN
jgi:hypothetical protein